MRPARVPLMAALLLLAACPLPQSVPSVPAGSVTPPRIVQDVSRPSATSSTLTTAGTTAAFDPNCPTAPFTVTVTVADENFSEAVDYRWFVDYDPTDPLRYNYLAPQSGQLAPPTQEPFTLRPVPDLTPFRPGGYGNDIHVLELVISNGFNQSADQASLPLPNRTPISGAQNSYEVQSHKWVFVPVTGCAAALTCAPCLP